MQEPIKQQPEWTQVLSMFDALFSVALKYAEPHIKRMVDEQVAQRIAALEARIDGATLTPLTHEYIAKVARESVALSEEVIKNLPDEDRIKDIADEVARDVMSEHVGEYDHDEYDRLEDKLDDKVSEAIDEYDFDDKINDALRSATISISV